jgi:hypothetical protein
MIGHKRIWVIASLFDSGCMQWNHESRGLRLMTSAGTRADLDARIFV